MKKNDIVKLTIENIGTNGEGVARIDGYTLFVPFAYIGEEVLAKIILAKKNFAVAKIQEVLKASNERIEPVCPHFTKCGGCQVMHLSKVAQGLFKKNTINSLIKRIAFSDFEADRTFQGETCLHYRNKLSMPITQSVDGEVYGGFYAPNSHRIVKMRECFLQKDDAMTAFNTLVDFANENKISGYVESAHKGLIRHIVSRSGDNQILITIVINGNSFPHLDKLIEKFKAVLNKPFGVYLNINKEKTNVITSNNFVHKYGLTTLEFNHNGISYNVLPQSFLQVNNEIAGAIYKKAVHLANLNENSVVVNAYSGAGLLSAYFAKQAKTVYGVEIVKEASISADNLARENGLADKMINITGDCGVELKKIIKELKEQNKEVVFVLDPPRKGVDGDILNLLKDLLPAKIVYISCDPSTLARDIGILTDTLTFSNKGVEKNQTPTPKFTLTTLQGFDMFPQTKHVETVAVLEVKI